MELDQKLVDLIEGIITVKQQEAYKQGFLHGKAGEAKSDKYVYYTRNSGIDKDQSDHYIKGYEHGMREKENPHKKDAEDHEAWREKTAAARKGRYYHESVEDTNYYVARKAVNNEEVLDEISSYDQFGRNVKKLPRKGTLAWEIMQERKKKEKDPSFIKHIEQIGNGDHYYGNAKVNHKDNNSFNESTWLDEVLTAKTPVSTWIEDFIKSDDPKFNGKSKEERRKMAIGAFYGAKKAVKEELEESLSTRYSRNMSKKQVDAILTGIENLGAKRKTSDELQKERDEKKPLTKVEYSSGGYEVHVLNKDGSYDVVNKKFASPVKAYDEADRHKIRLRNQMKEGLEESIKQGGSSQPKQRDYVIHFERDEPFNAPNPSKVMDSIELPGHSKEHVRFKFDNLVKEGDVSGVKVKHIMRKYN